MPADPTRRRLVTAVVAVPAAAAAGCSLGAPDRSSQAPGRGADVDPDVALLDEVAGRTESLVARYEATLHRHRGLRGDLRTPLAAHRAHAAALGEAAPPAPARARSGGGTTGSRPPAATRADVPGGPAAAVRALRAAERDASDALQAATTRAVSGPFARLLASMAAASAQHVRLLAEVDA